MTAEGPSSSRLAKRPPFRPGPERPGHGASLAMPRRRPERGANPGGRPAGASSPGPWPGLRGTSGCGEARTARSPRRRPRSRPPGRPSPGPPPAWHQLNARAPGPRRLQPPTPSRRPVFLLPSTNFPPLSPTRNSAAAPARHTLQYEPFPLARGRVGEAGRAGRRAGGRSSRGPAAPWNAGSRGPAPPLHAGK